MIDNKKAWDRAVTLAENLVDQVYADRQALTAARDLAGLVLDLYTQQLSRRQKPRRKR